MMDPFISKWDLRGWRQHTKESTPTNSMHLSRPRSDQSVVQIERKDGAGRWKIRLPVSPKEYLLLHRIPLSLNTLLSIWSWSCRSPRSLRVEVSCSHVSLSFPTPLHTRKHNERSLLPRTPPPSEQMAHHPHLIEQEEHQHHHSRREQEHPLLYTPSPSCFLVGCHSISHSGKESHSLY